MMKQTTFVLRRWTACGVVLCALAAAAGLSPHIGGGQARAAALHQQIGTGASFRDAGWEEVSHRFGGSKSDTKPVRDVRMTFALPTDIREIHVNGGDAVKAGQLLVRARDSEVVVALEEQRLKAESQNEINAAQNAHDLAKFKLDKLIEGGTASPVEQEEKRLEYNTSVTQLEQARLNAKLEGVRLTRLEAQAERYRLEAPFDGVVEEVFVELGEGISENDDVIRIVSTDRLRLDVFTPTGLTIERGLKKGDAAWVLVDLAGGAKLVRGEVDYVSPVADAVAGERRVRVEIENKLKWPAGTQAMVRFDQPEEHWLELLAFSPAFGGPAQARVDLATVEEPIGD